VLRVEALRAKKGDCLLLFHGNPDSPRINLVDGGPGGVWEESLRPRLTRLRDERPNERLSIGLLMVSHVDDDHINGLIQLTETLKRQQGIEDLFLDVEVLWHNSFDDLFGEAGSTLAAPGSGDVTQSSVDNIAEDLGLSEGSALALLSVGQGRTLRDNAAALAWTVNSPFDGLVQAGTSKSVVRMPGGMAITVLGPDEGRLREFQEKWDIEIKKQRDKLKTAAYLDDSVYNLASIVVLIEIEGRKLLFTGDARGDDMIKGAAKADLLDVNNQLRLDLLKVPHHGSDRNVEVDFFKTFPADHYVISGDGSHGNPALDTFRMLFEARGDDPRPFTIYLTYDPADFKAHRKTRNQPATAYPVTELRRIWADQKAAGQDFEVIVPGPADPSVSIEFES